MNPQDSANSESQGVAQVAFSPRLSESTFNLPISWCGGLYHIESNEQRCALNGCAALWEGHEEVAHVAAPVGLPPRIHETRHVDPQPTRQLSIHIKRRVTTAGATRVATRASRISALVGSQRVEDGSLSVDDDESAGGTLRTVARTLARARYQRLIGVAKQELLLAAHEARTAEARVAFEGPFEGEEGAAGRVLRWARLNAAVRVKGGSSDYG